MLRWLTADEQTAWMAYVRMRQRLDGEIAIGLARDGVSPAEYELLVPLSAASESRMRAKELAAAVSWRKSRLSKQLSRMAARGLLTRDAAPDDGRGLIVAITESGRELLETAAPHHVDLVRQLFAEQMTDSEARALITLSHKVITAADSLSLDQVGKVGHP